MDANDDKPSFHRGSNAATNNHPTTLNAPPHGRLRTQPFKTFYVLFELLVAPIRFLWWVLSSVPPSQRKRPSWSFQKAIAVSVLRRLEIITGRVGILLFIADHQTVSKGSKIFISWVDPAPPSLLNSFLTSWSTLAQVMPTRIPGYWFTKPGIPALTGAPARPGEKIIYHLHGGAYVLFSASPRDFMAGIGRGILAHAPPSIQRVFALEYRLSKAAPGPPANPFPAALLDALAGYVFLVRVLGFAPKDVVVVGDSAGGNLALALTRYLLEHPDLGLLPPGAMLLLSPWADLSDSHEDNENAAVCYIGGRHGGTMTYARCAFLGALNEKQNGELMRGRYISPASIDPRSDAPDASYAGWPKVMVMSGEAEALSGSIETLVGRMRRDIGEEGVKWYVAKDAVHDFLALWPLWVWEPERKATLKEIGAWLGTLV